MIRTTTTPPTALPMIISKISPSSLLPTTQDLNYQSYCICNSDICRCESLNLKRLLQALIHQQCPLHLRAWVTSTSGLRNDFEDGQTISEIKGEASEGKAGLFYCAAHKSQTQDQKRVVRQFLYPAFINPPHNLSFAGQFAFCPTGSIIAALIYLLHSITDLLSTNPFVIVIALDFSKAFETVRHSCILQKISYLDLPCV